jgi:hypothetical protein
MDEREHNCSAAENIAPECAAIDDFVGTVRLGVAVVLDGAKSGDPQKQLRCRLEKNARLYTSLYRA